MPRTAADTSTNSTTTGGRLSVSLPKETAALVDKLKDFFEDDYEKLRGIRIEMKPDQIIHTGLKNLVERIEAVGEVAADSGDGGE